eukprot:CAMPEP_0194293478 /NCGR_PEP_ID=MMETSP0169-20130528/48010_1 /TAXON_ID=218684 /ORGANISM="Corethron pennatum, Strain L29A3" /LENGTH=135 /DNA_ID=CAMNT_0039041995 /DNA_START=338 /DNA_END=742 /DNA_ORIENTATION=-
MNCMSATFSRHTPSDSRVLSSHIALATAVVSESQRETEPAEAPSSGVSTTAVFPNSIFPVKGDSSKWAPRRSRILARAAASRPVGADAAKAVTVNGSLVFIRLRRDANVDTREALGPSGETSAVDIEESKSTFIL